LRPKVLADEVVVGPEREKRNDLATSVLVGQVRSTAEDLLRAAPAAPERA